MQKLVFNLGVWLTGALWIGGVILLISGGTWIGDQFVPLVNLIATIILLIGLPVALVLLIFRTTRGWAGLILFIVSLPWWIWLWLVSFIYAASASLFWTILGVVLGGIGIVPVALIMALVRGDWGNLVTLLIASAVVIAFRWIGLGIIARAEERALIEGLQSDRDLAS